MLPSSRLLLLLAAAAVGQDQSARIGEIEFFGYAGLDLNEIRAALSTHEGDTLAFTDAAVGQVRAAVIKDVARATGHEPTDVSATCCDKQGQWMIYIGLPGKSNGGLHYHARPTGSAKLPADIVKLYERAMDANADAVRRGKAGEDDSKGYSLSEDPAYRSIQLEMRKYAEGHDAEIRKVLESSADAHERRVAAELLGYARQSKQQIQALAAAATDPDSEVRNNVTRALAVLTGSNASVSGQIPAGPFIDMLSSGSWSDRNKAGWLLSILVAYKDPKLLAEIRARAVVSLKEMAGWRDPGHADSFRSILNAIGVER